MESPDRRSDLRRRRLGASTAAHTTTSIRRTTIVKNPSIYLPTCSDPTEEGVTMGGWSGTVRGARPRAPGCGEGPDQPASWAEARAVHLPPYRSTATGTSKHAETAADVSTVPASPAPTIRPRRSSATCVVPGGISST